MSAPKKGKDLSALKARLAKKATTGDGPDEAEAPPPAEAAAAVAEVAPPAAAIPAPGEVRAAPVDIPAPGEVRPPMDIPAPGEVRKPVDIPPPGQVSPPPQAAMPVAAAAPPQPQRESLSDDPFSGGTAFDPNAGLIDDVGGEIKGRGSIGLTIFAGVIGVVVGLGLGWMAHKATDSRSRVDAAKSKAEEITKLVTQLEEARAKVALKVGEAKEALAAKQGDKAVEALSSIAGGEPIDTSGVFGWQLATMDPTAVKAFHKLASGYENLNFQAQFLQALATTKGEVIAGRASGPSSFMLIPAGEGGAMQLAEVTKYICGEIPEELTEETVKTLTPCAEDKNGEATGYFVRTEMGGESGFVPAAGIARLVPNPLYTFAIGANPEQLTLDEVQLRVAQLESFAGELKKASDTAVEGAKKLSDDPNVDGG